MLHHFQIGSGQIGFLQATGKHSGSEPHLALFCMFFFSFSWSLFLSGAKFSNGTASFKGHSRAKQARLRSSCFLLDVALMKIASDSDLNQVVQCHKIPSSY